MYICCVCVQTFRMSDNVNVARAIVWNIVYDKYDKYHIYFYWSTVLHKKTLIKKT